MKAAGWFIQNNSYMSAPSEQLSRLEKLEFTA